MLDAQTAFYAALTGGDLAAMEGLGEGAATSPGCLREFGAAAASTRGRAAERGVSPPACARPTATRSSSRRPTRRTTAVERLAAGGTLPPRSGGGAPPRAGG